MEVQELLEKAQQELAESQNLAEVVLDDLQAAIEEREGVNEAFMQVANTYIQNFQFTKLYLLAVLTGATNGEQDAD